MMVTSHHQPRRRWGAVPVLSLLVLSLSGARHGRPCPVAPPVGCSPSHPVALRLRGAGESDGDESGSVLQRPESSEHCNCGDPECPHAPEPPETAEEAQARERRAELEEYVRRVERGERLGAQDLSPGAARELSLVLSDGRVEEMLAGITPWWLLHPFGNASSPTPPERPARVAADGVAVQETRAELTHNGGRSTRGGWRGRGVGASGVLEFWGLLWAQDAEQVRLGLRRHCQRARSSACFSCARAHAHAFFTEVWLVVGVRRHGQAHARMLAGGGELSGGL